MWNPWVLLMGRWADVLVWELSSVREPARIACPYRPLPPLYRPPALQVCNHRFHNECLRQWGDTSCPVCRYCQHSAATTSHCAVCRTSAGEGGAAAHRLRRRRCLAQCSACAHSSLFTHTTYIPHTCPTTAAAAAAPPPTPTPVDLWICLICGHVGCGRYRGSHAAEHWQSCGHGYALELETQVGWGMGGEGVGGGGERECEGWDGAWGVFETFVWSPGRTTLSGCTFPALLGAAARVGLCERQLRAPPDPEQDRRQAGGGGWAGGWVQEWG